jgi:hypothetical protein
VKPLTPRYLPLPPVLLLQDSAAFATRVGEASRDPCAMSSRPSSSSSRRSSSPFSAGHRRPPTASSSSSSSYFSSGRLIPRSSSSSVSSSFYGGGGGGSTRSTTPSRRSSSVAPALPPSPVPFPSADELVIEDTSRSGDSISVTIRFRPLRWGSRKECANLLARGCE